MIKKTAVASSDIFPLDIIKVEDTIRRTVEYYYGTTEPNGSVVLFRPYNQPTQL